VTVAILVNVLQFYAGHSAPSHSLGLPLDAPDLAITTTIFPVAGSISARTTSTPAAIAPLIARVKSVRRKACGLFGIYSFPVNKKPRIRGACVIHDKSWTHKLRVMSEG
jgi:hypothetical protein